ncbi:hypothetical protein [Burkholderia sp. Ac-20349]
MRHGDTSERQVTLLRDLCDTMLAGSLCAKASALRAACCAAW